MPQFVLIIGEDPDLIDFSAPDVPPNMDAHKVMEGLNGSRDRLKGLGHEARILLTRDAATVDAQVSEALKESRYDVQVSRQSFGKCLIWCKRLKNGKPQIER